MDYFIGANNRGMGLFSDPDYYCTIEISVKDKVKKVLKIVLSLAHCLVVCYKSY